MVQRAKSLTTQVFEELLDDIVLGRRASGTMLSEKAVSPGIWHVKDTSARGICAIAGSGAGRCVAAAWLSRLQPNRWSGS